jgi:hypothetical protein
MGLPFSRIIYDPQERYLDLQGYAIEYKIFINEWKKDYNGRLICRVVHYFSINRFKSFYNKLIELGLKGIDDEGNIYEIGDKLKLAINDGIK